MNILITVGTEQFQFNSLMIYIDLLAKEYPEHYYVVQYGSCTVIPTVKSGKVFKITDSESFKQYLTNADLIISHCGEGSLLSLSELNKPYILVPRTVADKEHVDDHQLELANYLIEQGVPIATDYLGLVEFINNPRLCSFKYTNEVYKKLEDILPQISYSRTLLVSSSGGHFHTLNILLPLFKDECKKIVTFKNESSEKALVESEAVWAYHPTNRNIPNLIKNFFLAIKTVTDFKPDLVVTTGAGVAVPFCIVAKMLGAKIIFVESITRVKELSLSARMIYKLGCLDKLIVESKELNKKYNEL